MERSGTCGGIASHGKKSDRQGVDGPDTYHTFHTCCVCRVLYYVFAILSVLKTNSKLKPAQMSRVTFVCVCARAHCSL